MQRHSRTRPQSVCVTNHNAAGTRPQSVCATNLNAVDRQVSFEEQIFGVAFFYGGLAQLIVGIMELFKGNSMARQLSSPASAYGQEMRQERSRATAMFSHRGRGGLGDMRGASSELTLSTPLRW